ncbi:MAG: Gfo/Idh/MocA family oxidoreductase [Chloroflexaceae bacterium]|jgi:predicted dehydrogenase|nr:Gfo/Idh/MocA family oxidoreductase [Chloroflexaceae bacterium]
MPNWGILGTGRITRRLIDAVPTIAGQQVLAVASRSQEKADSFAHEWGIPRAYGSYEALLADPEVDYIYNALPNSLHAEWSIRAAVAGKHVLCEKPLAASSAEAEAMFAATRERKVFLMEGFMYRFHPQTLKIQELLAAGAIGEVRMVRVSFGFTATGDSNIRLNLALAGGALMDVGCYCVNFARMAVGEAPAQVQALARWSETSVDETLLGTLDYPGGAVAQIACSIRAARRGTAQIVGSAGILELDEPFTPTLDQPTTLRLFRGAANATLEEITIPAANHFKLEAEGFQRLVEQGHGPWPEMPLLETLDNAATADALLHSAREGRAVSVG